MHKERVYLFPMHLSKALPQARKNAQGIIHPRAGVSTHCAVLAKIVVVFWINGYPPQFHNGISPPPFPEVWSSSALNRFDNSDYIIFPVVHITTTQHLAILLKKIKTSSRVSIFPQ